jgi:hypothetical protein
VGLRAGLDRCGKSRPTGIRSPDRPARRQSLPGFPPKKNKVANGVLHDPIHGYYSGVFLHSKCHTVSRKIFRKFRVLTTYCVSSICMTALSTTYYYKLILVLFT